MSAKPRSIPSASPGSPILCPPIVVVAAIKASARRDWVSYLRLFDQGCADAFVRILPELGHEPPEVYWSLLSEVWGGTEAPGISDIDWRALFTDPRPGREALMRPHSLLVRSDNDDVNEIALLESLPDPVTVYRGVGCLDRARGLSWTLDRNKARWFARYAGRALARSGQATGRRGHVGQAYVLRGELARADVIAVLEGRKEREVIALPESVRSLRVIEPPEDAQAMGGER